MTASETARSGSRGNTVTCSPPLMNGSSLVCSAWMTQLGADEAEDHRQAVGQVDEPVEQAVEQEEQLPQAEQGEGVGGEDQVRLLGEAEDRRDRVDGEDQVGAADGDQGDDQRRDEPLAARRRTVSRSEWYSSVVGRTRRASRRTAFSR